MDERPRLETDILRPYFRKMRYRDDRYSVSIKLISDDEHFGFEVSMEVGEPHTYGAFPQGRVSLEQHTFRGHEGVHVQVNYHLLDNDLNIGRLYIVIDAHSDRELLEIAEGFVYTLYEMLSVIGPGVERILPEIFNVGLIGGIRQSKSVLMDKVGESLSKRMVEIRDLSGNVRFIEPEEVRRLLDSRREFVPLFGPILD